MTLEITDCTILLDASQDLWMGSHPNDEAACSDFQAAYSGAADYIGKQLGIDISVETATEPKEPESEQWAKDCDLWQMIHDCLYHDGDEWLFDESRCDKKVAEIRRKLA